MWSWFSPAVIIITCWLYIMAAILHLKTALSDPGIIPRKISDEEDNPFRSPPMTKSVSINNEQVTMKYCTTCRIYRPPRAVHCGVCGNCVDKFDHHWYVFAYFKMIRTYSYLRSPWTGNCVGRRNYQSYLFMLVAYFLLELFIVFSLVAKIIVLAQNSPNSGWRAFWEAIIIVSSFYCVFRLFANFFGLYRILLLPS